jgi:hypothetical protein
MLERGDFGHRHTPICWGHGPSGRVQAFQTQSFASGHRGTPPEDVLKSRQVSWLAGRRCCLAFPTPSWRQ